jgi:hypothetical protein
MCPVQCVTHVSGRSSFSVPTGSHSFESSGGGDAATSLKSLNRFDDAQAIFDQAAARKVDGGYLRLIRYQVAFLRGDSTQMEQQLAWVAGKPGDEDVLLAAQSDTEAYSVPCCYEFRLFPTESHTFQPSSRGLV